MPLVKVSSGRTAEWEGWARMAATTCPDVSVWRWDAAASRWVELPCGAEEWSLYDWAWGPLPGAPPGPLHAAVVILEPGTTVARSARTTFAVLGGDGRKTEAVGIDDALYPRYFELTELQDPTPEERAEARRILEEALLPFEPTPGMKLELLRVLGARFDLSQVRWPWL